MAACLGSSDVPDRWDTDAAMACAHSTPFVDRDGGRALTLTLWASDEAARASDQTADKSRASTVAATGVELLERGRYEVIGKR